MRSFCTIELVELKLYLTYTRTGDPNPLVPHPLGHRPYSVFLLCCIEGYVVYGQIYNVYMII